MVTFKTLAVVTLITATAAVAIILFTGSYPDVKERLLKFIDIPDEDPTPRELRGAEAMRDAFNSYNALKNSIQAAEGASELCRVKHPELENLYRGKRSSLTVEIKSTSSAGSVQLVRGFQPETPDKKQQNQGKIRILDSIATDLKPCLLSEADALETFKDNMWADRDLFKNIDDGDIVTGITFSTPREIAEIQPGGSAGDSRVTTRELSSYSCRVDSQCATVESDDNEKETEETTVKRFPYNLPDNKDKHYIVQHDGNICFFVTGDEGWFTGPHTINHEHYNKFESTMQSLPSCTEVTS